MAVRRASRQRLGSRRSGDEPYDLVLYLAGASPHSRDAINNLRVIADKHLKGRYSLRVVDLYQHVDEAAKERILAVPTLVKRLPPPIRRLVGNLSDEERVLVGLDIVPASREQAP